MKTIHYHKDGIAFPDGKAEEKAVEFLSSNNESIVVSTENFILATRALIKENRFNYSEIKFHFQGQDIIINKDGRCHDFPVGFCDHASEWLFRLINPR